MKKISYMQMLIFYSMTSLQQSLVMLYRLKKNIKKLDRRGENDVEGKY